MALCYQCHEHEAAVGLLCAHCVSSNKEQGDRRRQQIVALAGSKASIVSPRVGRPSIWAGVAGLIFLLLLLVYNFGGFGYGSFPPLLPQRNGFFASDQCIGKQRCLIVFLTPWCPACKASVGFVKSVGRFVRTNSSLGMQIVVGNDTEQKLRAMAGELGEFTYLDIDGTVDRALRGGGVPRWGVIDANRKIINLGSGLPAGNDEHHPHFQAFLRDELGLL